MRKILAALTVALTLLATDLVLATAPPAAAQVSPDATFDSWLDEVIIGFEPGFLPNLRLGEFLNGLPVTMRSDNGNFLTVKVPSLPILRQVLDSLPGVSYAESNGTMSALVEPQDPRFVSQYGPKMMGAPAAWDAIGFGSSNITVATVDSGVLKTQEDLAGPRMLQGYDYVKKDNNPDDTCSHGTHVAGIIGATSNNNLGIAGMSQASLLPMKALAEPLGSSNCSGSYANIAQAIMDAADQGASVISMSIGGPASSTLSNAVDYAYSRGAILVAAAGNDGGANNIDYPGAYPKVIAVGALDSSKTRASYSDRGPQLDIMAPGSNVLSTYTGGTSSYQSLSGTSMATPHVSGALALAMSCMPAATTVADRVARRDTLTNALYATADDLGVVGPDSSYGNGLARVDKLVAAVCPNVDPPENQPPTPNFSVTPGGLSVSVNAGASTDPDGDGLSYVWNFGDGQSATGVTATHTYGATGTYAIELTVDDGHGHSVATTKMYNASDVVVVPEDPDPTTPTLTSGQTDTITIDAANKYRKIYVPAGSNTLTVAMTGPSSPNMDLYVRYNARPTNLKYVCRPYLAGSNETCTVSSPQEGYWYIRAHRRSGSTGTITVTATVS